MIRQLYTVDHTFGKAPNFPVVYLVRQTSANAADPSATGGSETIFPGDQQRIVALLSDLPAQFVWVDRMEDVPRQTTDWWRATAPSSRSVRSHRRLMAR